MLWVLLLGTGNDSEVFESGLVYKIGLWWIFLVEIDFCIYGLLCLANKKVQEKLDDLKKKKGEISHLTIFFPKVWWFDFGRASQRSIEFEFWTCFREVRWIWIWMCFPEVYWNWIWICFTEVHWNWILIRASQRSDGLKFGCASQRSDGLKFGLPRGPMDLKFRHAS